MRSPFKFLDAFELRDRAVFFGRDEEIDTLYRMVHKNRLVLVYGPSGTGKTSLVQCGLAGRYDSTDWLPLTIRRGQNINTALAQALAARLDQAIDRVEPAHIDAAYARFLRPVYLLFDQFEELFILGEPGEQALFFDTILALYRAELPCRMLFIVREEYLAALYEFEKKLPSLFDRRLRVEPMNAARVADVLRQSFRHFNIGLEQESHNLGQIIDTVSAGRAGIQLPYLQVYLDQLWRQVYEEETGEPLVDDPQFEGPWPALLFSTDALQAQGELGDVLGRFLGRQRLDLQQALQRWASARPELVGVALSGNEINRLLDVFVTEAGTKRPVGLERRGDGLELHDIGDGTLDDLDAEIVAAGVDLLERGRLLRVNGDEAELAHDALATLIDRARTAEQRKLNEITTLLRHSLRVFEHSGGQDFPGHKLLTEARDRLDQMRLPDDLRDFYERSWAEYQRREHAALAEKQRQLEIAEATARQETTLREEAQRAREREAELRVEAERSRNRARRRAVFVTILAAISVGLLAVAIRYGFAVRKERQTAFDQRKAAEIARGQAQASADTARLERRKAEEQTELTQRALLSLQSANANLVDYFLRQADRELAALRYENALAQLKTAAPLKQKPQELARRWAEVVYFYTETGQLRKAQAELSAVAGLLEQPAGPSAAATRAALRQVLQGLHRDWFLELEHRYYPDLVDVPGGDLYSADGSGRFNIPSFKMARTETTVRQYNLYLATRGRNLHDANTIQQPAWGWQGDHPMVYVSWYDAIAYTIWLSDQRGLAPAYSIDTQRRDPNNSNENDERKYTVAFYPHARGFRLPTELEWEYAARGGPRAAATPYAGSANVAAVAWYKDNSDSRVHAVTQPRRANALGLTGLSGNVWEWCWNWGLDEIADGPRTVAFTGPESGKARVVRGGSYKSTAESCRVTAVGKRAPDKGSDQDGFRVVLGVSSR
jgi:formylglycine-generating enzyme required for sulfatase activity/energy-coupling factor transporter ATP-binding protein EcfA2